MTGPQRSGTRICSKMIAQDTGYKCFEESRVGSSFAVACKVLSDDGVVLHGPMLANKADLFNDDILVVFMIRDAEDIKASEKRIGWYGAKWGEQNERPRYNAINTKMPISEIKCFVWWHLQRGRIKNSIEILYDTLSEHPLWKDKKDRVDFEANQTE